MASTYTIDEENQLIATKEDGSSEVLGVVGKDLECEQPTNATALAYCECGHWWLVHEGKSFEFFPSSELEEAANMAIKMNCNNWRRKHKLPMLRRVALRKSRKVKVK